jgi:CrcB protein
MFNTIGVIAAGGALGAVMRHGVNLLSYKLAGDNFPWGTLAVNVVGSFAMGLFIAIFAHMWQPSQDMKLFLTTGILGGFTTFSAFSLDAVMLYERGALLPALAYVLASVIISISALFAGLALVRAVAA